MTTMGMGLEGWEQFMRATGASPATMAMRLRVMRALARHAGRDDPTMLDRCDVVAFLARPVKPWTKVTYWRTVQAWDRWAADFGHSDGTLLRGIPAPRQPSPVARPLSDAAVSRLLALPLTTRPRAYVALALFAALRVHEVAKVRAEDLDLDAGWLTVHGKGGSVRPVPVHEKVAELAGRMPEAGWWFPSRAAAGHVSANAVSQTIGNAMRTAGIQGTAHMLRDTAATRLQREWKDIRVTQAFLRHQSITATMKYTAVADEALQAAARSMNWEAA